MKTIGLISFRRLMMLLAMFTAILIGMLLARPVRAAETWLPAINISPQIASDGHRFVAFQRRDGRPVVLDTFSGKRKVIRGSRYCQPRDIGGGRVLLICPEAEDGRGDTGFRARVASVRSGRSIKLKKSHRIFDAYEIGSHWVAISFNYAPWGSEFTRFLNWRTGFRKSVKALDYRSGVDLDRPRLSPGKIKTFRPDFRGYPNPFFGEPVFCRGESAVVVDWKDQLRLWLDRKHSVRLGAGNVLEYEQRCQWYQGLKIGRNWVTWSRRNTVHAYNIRTGQRFNRTFNFEALISPLRDGVAVALKTGKEDRAVTKFKLKVIRPGGNVR